MKKATLILLLIFSVNAIAQTAPEIQKESFESQRLIPIFDPSKISMRQSYSLSFYSGGGHSGSIGYYLNSIEYAVANPLKIRVDLGYLHSPSNLISKNASVSSSGMFVPAVSVDWRPTDNFRFNIDFRQTPGYLRSDDYYRNHYFWEE